MTNLSDTLAALSEAAKVTDKPVEVRLLLQKRFENALINAYRTGQLVPVPSVERVARAVCDALRETAVIGGVDLEEHLTLDPAYWRDVATAVIAAMQEGRE